ncbi:MAG: PAS domain S-box protein [Anaerolineae bacterium]|nr:PAS domain S-box protein [Anaerolineae bacterium]
MTWDFNPFAIPLAGSAIVLVWVLAYILRRAGARANNHEWPFLALVAAQLFWLITYGLEISGADEGTIRFWNDASYPAIVALPVLWLVFVLSYLGQRQHLKPRQVALWFVIPAITLFLLWTNNAHHLLRISSTLETSGPFPALRNVNGPWFVVHGAYSYLLSLAAAYALLRAFRRTHGIYRRQVASLLACSVLVLAANLLTILRLHPFGALDLTPFTFPVVSGFIVWNLHRYRLLDIVPTARDKVIESMGDGVIVLDWLGRIVDFNPAAAALTGFAPAAVIGQDVAQVLADLPDILARLHGEQNGQAELTLPPVGAGSGGGQRYISLSVSPLYHWRGVLTGHVLVMRDVTAIRYAQETLHETERRYRGLFERTSYGLVVTDVADRVIEANWQAAAMLDYTLDELLEINWTTLISEREHQQMRAFTARLLEDETLPVYERIFRRKDGSEFPADINVALIRDAAGQPQQFIHLITDISARKQTQASEREQRSLAEALRDTAAVLTSTLEFDEVLDRILDNVGRVVPHDAANIMLVESGVARVVGRRGYARLGLEDAVLAVRYVVAATPNLRRMAESRQPNAIPDVRLHPGWVRSPSTNWIESYAGAPIMLDDEVIGFLNLDSATTGFFSRAHAERLMLFAGQAAIAIHNARLYGESQERNRKLALLNRLTHIGTATLEMDQLLQTLADTAASIVGGDGCFITFWDPVQRRAIPTAAYGPLRDQYREVGQQQPGEITLTESVLKEGRPLPVLDVYNTPYMSRRIAELFPSRSVLALPLRADNQGLGALILAFNLPHHFTADEIAWAEQAAELIALALAKARVYAQLQDRNRELDAFSHTVAHDLQSPLNLVIGYTGLVLEDSSVQLSADALDFLQVVRNSANQMSRMIDSLLLLATLRDAQQVIDVVETGPVVAAAVDRLRGEIEQRGVTLVVEPGLPPARGHGPWLEEVFANLIGNAIKYIGQRNTDPCIWVRGQVEGASVRYEVEDNGIGITTENQAALFAMFARFDKGEARGFGLGLSIVLRIVRKLNGEVGVTSEPGQGSTFWFTLPAP